MLLGDAAQGLVVLDEQRSEAVAEFGVGARRDAQLQPHGRVGGVDDVSHAGDGGVRIGLGGDLAHRRDLAIVELGQGGDEEVLARRKVTEEAALGDSGTGADLANRGAAVADLDDRGDRGVEQSGGRRGGALDLRTSLRLTVGHRTLEFSVGSACADHNRIGPNERRCPVGGRVVSAAGSPWVSATPLMIPPPNTDVNVWFPPARSTPPKKASRRIVSGREQKSKALFQVLLVAGTPVRKRQRH